MKAIEASNLQKDRVSGFLMHRKRVVTDLDLSIEAGRVFGLIGPNGAGKSTTVKMLVGLLRPDQGKVTILGHPAGAPIIKQKIGYLPENPFFYGHLTGREFLDFAASLFGLSGTAKKERISELLSLTGLTPHADKRLSAYSKGMLQRAGLAQALINDPEILFLDEPMSGLDPIGIQDVREIVKSLKQRGKTVFLNTHLLEDVQILCDEIAVMDQGRIIKRALTADLADQSIRDYFFDALASQDSQKAAPR